MKVLRWALFLFVIGDEYWRKNQHYNDDMIWCYNCNFWWWWWWKPIDTEYDEHKWGEDVSPSPDHHQHLASHVPSVPLKFHQDIDIHCLFYNGATVFQLVVIVSRRIKLVPLDFRKSLTDFDISITSIMILQLVSIGMVMKEMMASAMVRWNTR